MSEFVKKHILLVYFIIGTLVVGLLYSATTSKIYLATSRAALLRQKIEDPDKGSEESRNRWIWIRDGLNLKSILISDESLKVFLSSNERAKAAFTEIKNESAAIEALKKSIEVQYTGADENNFIISVKSTDPVLALELNQFIFARLKNLAIQSNETDFNAIVNQLHKTADIYGSKSNEYGIIQNKILKLSIEHSINQTQRERGFQVIFSPALGSNPIWPKWNLIILVSVLTGLLLGLFAEFAVSLKKSR